MKVKVDLSKDGLSMFFKPYEIEGWNVLWNTPKPIGSGAVWKMVNEYLGPGNEVSRTSVIFFLNRQVDIGFMGWTDATGKGGHHRLYYPKVSMLTLAQTILDDATTHLETLCDQAHDLAGGTSLVFDGDEID